MIDGLMDFMDSEQSSPHPSITSALLSNQHYSLLSNRLANQRSILVWGVAEPSHLLQNSATRTESPNPTQPNQTKQNTAMIPDPNTDSPSPPNAASQRLSTPLNQSCRPISLLFLLPSFFSFLLSCLLSRPAPFAPPYLTLLISYISNSRSVRLYTCKTMEINKIWDCSALTCCEPPARHSEFTAGPNRVTTLTPSIVPRNNNTT